MRTEIVEYTVDLSYPPLSEAALSAAKRLVRDNGFSDVRMTERNLAWDSYSGRDTDRRVLRFLREIASIVKNADGEISASLTSDTDEEKTESYRVRDGELIAV